MSEVIKDIKQNIIQLRNRLITSQDFKIHVHYIDKGKEEHKTINRSDFAKLWHDFAKRELWILHHNIGSNYIIAHSNSLRDLENNLEKLMLELGKIEMVLAQQSKDPIARLKEMSQKKKDKSGEAGNSQAKSTEGG